MSLVGRDGREMIVKLGDEVIERGQIGSMEGSTVAGRLVDESVPEGDRKMKKPFGLS